MDGSENLKLGDNLEAFCIICGNKFNARPNRVKIGQSKFCSKKCFSKTLIGKPLSQETKLKLSEIGKKRICSKETKEKMSISQSGKNNAQWKGGVFFLKKGYSPEFNKRLKRKIRERDSYTCQKCGISESETYRKLDVHHKDFNKYNTSDDNLITLCHTCHGFFHRKGG